jgi:hypothetical protein
MKFALLGAGKLGERYYNLLKDEYDIVCFADNDPDKQGTQYQSLDVVSPSKALEDGLNVIVAFMHENIIDLVKQLFNTGIKKLHIPDRKTPTDLKIIDLTAYDDLSEKTNKICVIRQRYAGAASYSLIKDNPFDDIEIVMINGEKMDSEFYYHYLTSSLMITQFHENFDDNKKSIELWHGFPIKAVCYLSKEKYEHQAADQTHRRFMEKDIVCSLSELYSIFFGYCLYIPYDKLRITGYPRNDSLFKTNGKENLETIFGKIDKKHIIIYMPTFRAWDESLIRNGESTFLFDMPMFNEEDFNEFLQKKSILFIIKMHAFEMNVNMMKETNNVKVLTDADGY